MNAQPDRLDQILSARAKPGPSDGPVIAVPGAHNPEIIESVRRIISEKLARFLLIGPKDTIDALLADSGTPSGDFEVIGSTDEADSCNQAAGLAARGEAQILMKGLVQTSTFVRSILAASPALVPQGGLVSHVAVFDIPAYHKLLLLTDAAITVNPSVEQRLTLIKNAIPIAESLGIPRPRVACIAPSETVSDKVPSTGECADVVSRVEADSSINADVDGPFGLDVAVNSDAARTKGIESSVAGDTDMILAPNLDTGNALYKSLTAFAGAAVAGVVAGARIPVVLTSRADSDATKYASIKLAIAAVRSAPSL